jgi:hypothetical protein
MRRIRISDPQARELIGKVAADRECMPVRTLETLIARGEAGMGMILVGMREAMERRLVLPLQWSAAALGQCGDPGPVPDLTHLLRVAWRAKAVGLGFAAAESVARIGGAAEAMLLEHAGLTPAGERYWFVYAAGRIGSDGAAEFLLRELAHNRELADAAALALADMGRRDALPALERALGKAKAWQLPALECAVLALHGEQSVLGRYTEDWRLRYRYTPDLGHFPTAWPCLSAILRSRSRGRRGVARSVTRRGSADIIAAGAQAMRERSVCELCRTGPAQAHTGVGVCDECAPHVAVVQADCLLDVQCKSNDIFDVLDTIDTFFTRRDQAGAPQDEAYHRHLLARAACHWLVEQGIESTAAGAAALLAESAGCNA